MGLRRMLLSPLHARIIRYFDISTVILLYAVVCAFNAHAHVSCDIIVLPCFTII